jgi:hypothetical protein
MALFTTYALSLCDDDISMSDIENPNIEKIDRRWIKLRKRAIEYSIMKTGILIKEVVDAVESKGYHDMAADYAKLLEVARILGEGWDYVRSKY